MCHHRAKSIGIGVILSKKGQRRDESLRISLLEITCINQVVEEVAEKKRKKAQLN